MLPKGKLLMVWTTGHLKKVYGPLKAAVDAAVAAGFAGILVKIANGTYPWLPDTTEGKDLPELIALARERGLQVHVWVYSYAHTVSGERSSFVRAWKTYGGDSLVIDAENEYKKAGAGNYAHSLIAGLRIDLPGIDIGYTSYRFPSLHGEYPPGANNAFPFNAFQEACDYAAPQVYFEQAHNPGEQLEESKAEYDDLTPKLPYIPIGPTYNTSVWTPTPADLDEFSQTAHELDLQAIIWYRWDTAVTIGLWNTIAKHKWPVDTVKRHWTELQPGEKDYIIFRMAQNHGYVDKDGYVTITFPTGLLVRRAIQALAQRFVAFFER
jgi:hypothetical protein